jgi:hypothetical protein
MGLGGHLESKGTLDNGKRFHLQKISITSDLYAPKNTFPNS